MRANWQLIYAVVAVLYGMLYGGFRRGRGDSWGWVVAVALIRGALWPLGVLQEIIAALYTAGKILGENR